MTSAIKQHSFKLLVLISLIGLGVSLYFWINQESPPLPSIKQAPDFTLSDVSGNTVQLQDTHGKVRLLEFLFTSCPDICPMTTYNMVKLQDILKQENLWGSQVEFLSVTFDPLKDTSEVFKAYGDRMGMDYSAWTLLTGTEKETAEVANNYGVLVQKMPDGSFVHTVTSLFLIDPVGNIRKIFPMGEEMDNELILGMVRQLVRDE
ncbi:protein SCO1/2 [Paenibacillus mucilaginosus]|uniref:SCO family protein n=1 Tax=Paenibacillus mucilaginosus TaxID=61624 RepID=UPI003D23CCBF